MLNKVAGQSRARAETDEGKTVHGRVQPCIFPSGVPQNAD